MSKIKWDQTSEKKFETGVDHGVLYPQASGGAYPKGVAWNGLTGVNQSPSGADDNDFYADNILYGSLRGAERFGGGITAYMAPDEWAACDGSVEVVPGVFAGQQNRQRFGLCYRTLIGNDTEGTEHGYKIHLVYNASASPSDRDYETMNENPDMMELSWDFTTLPVAVETLDPVSNKPLRPMSHLEIDSTKLTAEKLTAIETILYGTDGSGGSEGTDARLPLPDEVFQLLTA